MAATVMALSGKTRIPGAEGLVGGDEHGSSLVSGGDQLEEDAGFGLALLHVGEIVEDQEVILVEFLDGGGEAQLLAGGLQLLDEIGGAGEEHAIAIVDEGMTESGPEMAFADAGWAEEQDVLPAIDPCVALGEGEEASLADHWHGGEVEGVEGLAGAAGATPARGGRCAVAGARRPHARRALRGSVRRASFGVGGLGEAWPHAGEGGQTQLGEQNRQPGGIDGDGRLAHCAAPAIRASYAATAGRTTTTAGASPVRGAKRRRSSSASGSRPASRRQSRAAARSASQA